MCISRSKSAYFSFLSLIGVVFFFMNYFTPLYNDDWHYCFIYGTHTPIKSVCDIMISQYSHYFNVNGRFVPHFFVQLFDGILNKEVFNVVNTLVFMTFLYLISYLLKKEYKSYYVSTSLALFLIFFLMPGFGFCFLWMSGACNYMWSATFIFVFIIMMKKGFKNKYLFALLFVFGIVCGWTHEAISLGVGLGYFTYFIFRRKELNRSNIALLSGFYIGVLLLVFSPASIHRALGKEPVTFDCLSAMRKMFFSLSNMDNTRLLPILLISMLVFSVFNKKKVRIFLKSNIMEMSSLFFNFLFVLWTTFETDHSRFGFELFSIIMILRLFADYQPKRLFVHAANLMVLCFSVYVITLQNKNDKDYKDCMTQIANSKSLILTNSVICNTFFNRFIVHFTDSEIQGKKSDYYYRPQADIFMCKYFNREDIYFVPQFLYDQVKNHSEDFTSFRNVHGLIFAKLIQNDEEINKITAELAETDFDNMPFYFRPIARKMSKYTFTEVDISYYSVITIEQKKLLIVSVPPGFEGRLRRIIVE